MSSIQATESTGMPGCLPGQLPRGPLQVDSPPHQHAGEAFSRINRTVVLAGLPAAVVGLVVFGSGAGRILVTAVCVAVVAEWVFNHLMLRPARIVSGHAVMIGLLFALTLPPNVRWEVPLLGSILAVVVGKGILGGLGNYLWHPALIGRIGVQMLFNDQLTPDRWPVLARGHLLFGDLGSAIRATDLSSGGAGDAPTAIYFGWYQTSIPAGHEAWSLPRPLEQLHRLSAGRGELFEAGSHPIMTLIRDHLPPWEDALVGVTGGGLGETSAIALIIGGLYLMYRKYARWHLLLSVLVSAALAAAILPIRIGPIGSDGLAAPAWFPGLEFDRGIPVGLIYVLYHLACGELMIGAFLFATDVVASPLTARGQIVFGVGIGVLTVLFRLYGLMPCACYWAILVMNTFVPIIDRRTKRRVYGT